MGDGPTHQDRASRLFPSRGDVAGAWWPLPRRHLREGPLRPRGRRDRNSDAHGGGRVRPMEDSLHRPGGTGMSTETITADLAEALRELLDEMEDLDDLDRAE